MKLVYRKKGIVTTKDFPFAFEEQAQKGKKMADLTGLSVVEMVSRHAKDKAREFLAGRKFSGVVVYIDTHRNSIESGALVSSPALMEKIKFFEYGDPKIPSILRKLPKGSQIIEGMGGSVTLSIPITAKVDRRVYKIDAFSLQNMHPKLYLGKSAIESETSLSGVEDNISFFKKVFSAIEGGGYHIEGSTLIIG